MAHIWTLGWHMDGRMETTWHKDGRMEWVPVSKEEEHEGPEGRARVEGVQAAERALDREPVCKRLRAAPCPGLGCYDVWGESG